MQCPACHSDSNVVDSRTTADGSVRRRRVCSSCKRRFTTYERVGSPNLKVVKRNDKTEPFSSDKLVAALQRVCRHRPKIRTAALVRMVRSIEAELVDNRTKTIRSGQIAALVLGKLKEVDSLAYERFAANYTDEAGRLRTEPAAEGDDDTQLNFFDKG